MGVGRSLNRINAIIVYLFHYWNIEKKTLSALMITYGG